MRRSHIVFTPSAMRFALRLVCAMLLAYFLLDHPIRPHQHVRWNRQADLLRRFQVDHQLKLRRLLHRQIRRLGAFKI